MQENDAHYANNIVINFTQKQNTTTTAWDSSGHPYDDHQTILTFTLKNKGDRKISNIRGTIHIQDKNGKELCTSENWDLHVGDGKSGTFQVKIRLGAIKNENSALYKAYSYPLDKLKITFEVKEYTFSNNKTITVK